MTKSLGEVVRKLRQDKSLTLEALVANIDGYDAANLSRFERSQQGITLEKLRELAKALGVPVSQIYQESDAATGKAVTVVNPADITSLPNINRGGSTSPDTKQKERGIAADTVREKDVYLALVCGSNIREGETMSDLLSREPGEQVRFEMNTLHNAGVAPDSAVAFTLEDNNLDPVIPAGSLVAVATAETSITNGTLYALNHAGLIRVARVYKIPGGGFRLKHYNNEEYAEEMITGDNAERVVILGRVFWYSVTL